MKTISKMLSAVLAIGLAITLLAGCGDQQAATGEVTAANTVKEQAETTVETQAAPQEKTKISVWTQSRADQNYMVPKVEEYNNTNTDGIEIDYQMYTDNFIQALDLAFASGSGPDVMQDSVNSMVKYIPMGYLEPIDQYLTPEYKARFGNGAFLETINVFDGKTYSLPAFGTTTRLFYNKGIFEKAGITETPKTVEEMVKTAQTITEKLKGEGIYGFAINLKSPASAFQRSVDMINERSGGVRYGFDFAQGRYDMTTYKPILEQYREMFASGAAFPGCESLDIDPLRTQFAAGKIGMYISWTHAEPGVYANQFPTQERWDCVQLPTVDGTIKGTQHIVGGSWYCLTSGSKNKDKGWKVLEFIYSDELQAGYHEAGLGIGMIPSALKIAKSPETLVKWPNLAMNEHDSLWPNIPLGIKPEGQDMYTQFAGYVLGSKDYSNIDKMISDLNESYNAAYDKAIAAGKNVRQKYDGFDPMNPIKSIQ